MQTPMFSAPRRHRGIAAGAVAATALAGILGFAAQDDDSTTVEAAGAVASDADTIDEVALLRASRRAANRTNAVASGVAETLAAADQAEVEAAGQADVEPAPAPTVAPTVEPEPEPEPAAASHWDRLADCESGDWDANGSPIAGSARWDYGVSFSHGDIFEGGLNFHPGTWDSYRLDGMPDHAGQASRTQQITVAEQVLADQGWGAWPVCSSKIGLR